MARNRNSQGRISRRGPVTREQLIYQGDGSVAVPFSTNRWTRDEYFLVDADYVPLIVGNYFYVNNDDVYSRERNHFSVRCTAWRREFGTDLVARILHQPGDSLTVDHCYHWTDNRRASVEVVTISENVRRGAALYHSGRKNRVGKVA